ncbi:hypothetical protein MOSE0_H03686 [Monosporozyma servazzii]
MKVKVKVITPVFAWSWDPRSEKRVYTDNTKRDYSYIINYDGHSQADTQRENQQEEEKKSQQKDIEKERSVEDVQNPIFSIYSDKEILQRQRSHQGLISNHIPDASSIPGPSHVDEDNNMSEDDVQQEDLDSIDCSTDGLEDQFDYDDDENNVCGICRANYNGTCPTCKIPGDSCPLVIGKCKHYFHYHCIIRWLKTPHSKCLCPMCRRRFELKRYYLINDPVRREFYETMQVETEKHIEMNDDLGFWLQYRADLSDTSSSIDELIKRYKEQVFPVKDVLYIRPKALESLWDYNNVDRKGEFVTNKEINDSDSSISDEADDELDQEDQELLETIKYDYKTEAKKLNKMVLKLYKRERQIKGLSPEYSSWGSHGSPDRDDSDSNFCFYHSKGGPRRNSASASNDLGDGWTSHDTSSGGSSAF